MGKPYQQRLKNYYLKLINGLDVIILIPLLFGAYQGYKKGLSMTIFKILALLLGVVLGFKLVHITAKFLVPHIGDANGFLPVISFLTVFISVIILVNITGRMIKKLLDLTLLGSFDNIAGAALNFVKWAFVLGTVFWLLERGNINISPKQIEGSYFYDPLVSMAPRVVQFFSQLIPFASDTFDYIKDLKIEP